MLITVIFTLIFAFTCFVCYHIIVVNGYEFIIKEKNQLYEAVVAEKERLVGVLTEAIAVAKARHDEGQGMVDKLLSLIPRINIW